MYLPGQLWGGKKAEDRALVNPNVFGETISSNTKYLGINLTRHR